MNREQLIADIAALENLSRGLAAFGEGKGAQTLDRILPLLRLLAELTPEQSAHLHAHHEEYDRICLRAMRREGQSVANVALFSSWASAHRIAAKLFSTEEP